MYEQVFFNEAQSVVGDFSIILKYWEESKKRGFSVYTYQTLQGILRFKQKNNIDTVQLILKKYPKCILQSIIDNNTQTTEYKIIRKKQVRFSWVCTMEYNANKKKFVCYRI